MTVMTIFFFFIGHPKIIVRSCDTQAHLGLGLQPDNMAYTIPKPNSQATFKSSERESDCSVVLHLGCSTVSGEYHCQA